MLKNFLKFRKSYFARQIEIYVLLAIFAVVIIGVIANIVVISTYKRQTLEYNNRSLAQLNNELEIKISRINIIVRLINNDYEKETSLLHDLILERRGEEINNIEEMEKFFIISNYIKELYDGVNSVFIITAGGRVLFNGKNYYHTEYDFLSKDWFNQIKNQRSKDFMILDKDLKRDYLYSNEINLLTFGKNIYNPSETWDKIPVATMLVNIDSSFFKKTIENYNLVEGSDIYILNSESEVIYNKDTSLISKKLSFYNQLNSIKEQNEEELKVKIDGENMLVSCFASEKTGWILLALIPERQMNRNSNLMRLYFSAIIFCYLIIGLIISAFFARKISRRMKKIIGIMEVVEKGDLDQKYGLHGDDELGIISGGLDRMIQKLKKYIDDIYVTESMKRQAELYALKSQIDPHFLFNILEVIRMRVLMSGDKATAEIVKLLGRFYQEKLDYGNDLISLEDELKLVVKYLELEKYRREENIELVYNLEERYSDCKIPVFSFQPVIENILKHGIVKGQDVKISIDAVRTNEKLAITISDNGRGMEESKASEIVNELEGQVFKKSFKHVGIKNVNYRLKLNFGVEYGISMESIYGAGTSITLYIPIDAREEK